MVTNVRDRSASTDEAAAVAAAAAAGDEHAFGQLVDRHRRELHVHCYRMLGSFDEAEDLVQETFLRAWRSRDTFDGGAGFRAWLYRIATNACLDAIRAKDRRVPTYHSYAEVPWLQPYPDRLLDEMAPSEEEPDAVVVARETIELAYLAVIQLLPPKQRAALILRDVLGWSAAETASLLDTSVAAANSALQRARATMQEHVSPREVASSSESTLTEDEQTVLAGFIDAHERGDFAASIALMREDIRVTMPPAPYCYQGRDAMQPLLERAFAAETMGDWRLVPVSANRQPAAVSYLRRPGDSEFRAFKIDVLRVEDGMVAEVTTFGPGRLGAYGVPEILRESQ